MKFRFRDYQTTIINSSINILNNYKFVYLAMEVRTGKTLTSLGICQNMNAKSVLFVTKKKAISFIQKDYDLFNPSFDIEIINYESLHKVRKRCDFLILDEAHCMGKLQKPSKRSQMVKNLVDTQKPYVILMSGTPTPENFSQIYHQIYMCPGNPFREHTSFYKFAREYINVTEKKFNGLIVRDYTGGKREIMEKMKPYMISFSQKQAGFKVETSEQILKVQMQEQTYDIANRLRKDRVVEGKDEVILGDTPIKLMTKLHQIYSGTIKFESGATQILDLSKGEFIKKFFHNKKIGIFYKYKAELDVLKKVFEDKLTTDLDEFKEFQNKSIALQIQSGREGISLKEADCLVYYNIDYSATSYWQSRDRMTTKYTKENKLYWIFSNKGIENKIYKAVINKRDYTTSIFKKEFLTL